MIAGIDTKQDGPGYKQITIKPTIGGNLTYASADYETGYGTISSHWKLDAGSLSLDVTIPANTTATIYVPVKDGSTVTQNGKTITGTDNSTVGYAAVNVGSGNYHFSSTGF